MSSGGLDGDIDSPSEQIIIGAFFTRERTLK